MRKILKEHVKLTSRLSLAVMLLGMTLGLGSAPAHAVALKERSMIETNMITLGDIFHDLPRDAGRILGPAPRPGHDMVLNARTLMRIAIALDLPWRPNSSGDYVVLSRAATVIENDLIEDALRKSFIKKEIGEKFDIKFSEGTPEIILPKDMEPSVEVSHLNYNKNSKWFTATFVAPSQENPLQVTKVSGRIDPLVSIPTLRTPLRAGDIIGMRDIEMKDISVRHLKGDPVLDAQDLIGMTPRRFLHAGAPIRGNEIEPPQIVERGDSITMVFRNAGLELTASGKALQNGAKGDIISVVNASSNRTIDALITGEREVTVETF